MSEIVEITISHRFGQTEAVRRIKEGFARANGHLGPMMSIEQETWDGSAVRFRVRALGQIAPASIEVLDDALVIKVAMPWLLAKAANHFLPVLRREASLLLEKE